MRTVICLWLFLLTAGAVEAHVLWLNERTGELNVWRENENGVVEDKVALSWTCAGTCARDWKLLDAKATARARKGQPMPGSILWLNEATGQLSYWLVDFNSGRVHGKRDVSWTCKRACLNSWRFVGTGTYSQKATPHPAFLDDHGRDILWHNPSTGELSAWIVSDNGQVEGTKRLSRTCGTGCAEFWKPVGAYGGARWHDWQRTGKISRWIVDFSGRVSGEEVLAWKCGPDCTKDWRLVNINGDLLWHNAGSGQLGRWLVDGTAVKQQILSWTCGAGCTNEWRAVAGLPTYDTSPIVNPR